MDTTRLDVVRRYHARTKHRPEGYAPGPETLDWDAQPSPFRHFAGAPAIALPLEAAACEGSLDALYLSAQSRGPLTLATIAALLQLSLGISAWKSNGVERWAVRANPSSGNLHPTEAYVLSRGVQGLADGLHHYLPEEHALELRAGLSAAGPGCCFVGLSSLIWREAWKYGERAFRYVDLDLGHAVAALACAGSLLGLSVTKVPGLAAGALGSLLGLDRHSDFPQGVRKELEREEPGVLLAIAPAHTHTGVGARALLEEIAMATWHGSATRVDPRPMYSWPALYEVAAATRHLEAEAVHDARVLLPARPLPRRPRSVQAVDVVLGRRSGQRYDRHHVMSREAFATILNAAMPRRAAPWSAFPQCAKLALLLFVHRVEGLTAGVYLLPRFEEETAALAAWLKPELAPVPSPELPAELGLLKLCSVEPQQLARLTRAFSCQQDIASSACFTLGMLADFEANLAIDPARYRTLFREAGVLGQVLYLEAEALGYRGTGIGCFLDDVVHGLVSRGGEARQSLYHFAIGLALEDPRIETTAPYAERKHVHSQGELST
jgi:SagB-type dehydrogenase family enzyme